MASSTARLTLPLPVGSDAPSELRTAIGQSSNTLDAAVVYAHGTIAARAGLTPVAGTLYFATDVDQWSLYTGSAWEHVIASPDGSLRVAGVIGAAATNTRIAGGAGLTAGRVEAQDRLSVAAATAFGSFPDPGAGGIYASGKVQSVGGFIGGILRPDGASNAISPGNGVNNLHGVQQLSNVDGSLAYLQLDGGVGKITFQQPAPGSGGFSNTMMVMPSGSYVYEANQAGVYYFTLINPGGASFSNVGFQSGAFLNSSDERLKENVSTVDPAAALSQVNQLRPVDYTWIDDTSGRHDLGFIAQEVQPVVPEVVRQTPTPELADMLSVDYDRLVPVLVAAVQQLSAQVAELQAKLAA